MADKRRRETKVLPSTTMSFDAETGIVEAYVSIMGILDDDDPPDLIEAGAFVKSVAERGPSGAGKIRTLWQHDWQEVIGIPLAIQEHGREHLPGSVLARYPEATGGLYAKTQFVLDVQRGREAHALYKAGAMGEWSIGFDTITGQYEKQNEQTFRRIKEIRLWEYSPVTWGMNPATVTTSVKNGIQDEAGIREPLERIAGLLGLDADLETAELMEAIEQHLRNSSSDGSLGDEHAQTPGHGVEPPEGALNRVKAARLRVRLAEINLRLSGQRARE